MTSQRRSKRRVRLTCPPGCGHLVASELKEHGAGRTIVADAWAAAELTARQIYSVTVGSRIAERVLVEIASFTAPRFADLEAGSDRVAWELWVDPAWPVRVRVSSKRSRLRHTGAVAERVIAAVERSLGSIETTTASPSEDPRPRVSRPSDPTGAADPGSARRGDTVAVPTLIDVRLRDDRATISVDAAGDRLDRRGWRLEVAKAPMAPTVAAAVLRAAGHRRGESIVDPCCGAGTLVIEAGLSGRPSSHHVGRPFGFQRWPSFEPGTWASVSAGIAPGDQGVDGDAPTVALVGSDRDAGAVAAATANAERAGVSSDCRFERRAVSAAEPPPGVAPGLVVSNPPWGARTGSSGDVRDLWAAVGNVLRDRFDGWRVALVAPSSGLVRSTGLEMERVLRLSSGGLGVGVWLGSVEGREPSRDATEVGGS